MLAPDCEGGTMTLYGATQLADSIRTIRKNRILIVEDIPEEQYAYRPTPDRRSVAEPLWSAIILIG
jgi:hypothetical protein